MAAERGTKRKRGGGGSSRRKPLTPFKLPKGVTLVAGPVPALHRVTKTVTHYVSGLLDDLRARFWPNYQRPRGTGYGASSIERGKFVEAEIAAWLADPDGIASDPLSIAFLDWVTEADLVFAGAQVPIYDSLTHRWTPADFVFRERASGDYVIVELKTGYAEGIDEPCAAEPTLQLPLEKIASTARNHALLQLGWAVVVTRDLLKRRPETVRGVLVIINQPALDRVAAGESRSAVFTTELEPSMLSAAQRARLSLLKQSRWLLPGARTFAMRSRTTP